MRVETLLGASARRTPEKVALVVGDERVTYAELDTRSDRLAYALLDRGVTAGDRVAIFLDNSVETVVALFAVLKAGAVFSTINPTTKVEKLAYILTNCRAVAVVTEARLLPVAATAIDQTETVAVTVVARGSGPPAVRGGIDWVEALAAGRDRSLEPVGNADGLAMIIYTSGSTGAAKGVMMTHHNILAATRSVATYLENTATDVILSVLPLSFGYGLNQIFTSCLVGATVVLEKSFSYPATVLELFDRERVTGFPLVPTIAAMLLRMKTIAAGRFPYLRYITNAAAALPLAHLQQVRERFAPARLYSMYGQTECTRTLYLPPDQLDNRPESVGCAIPGTEVYLVDEDGRRLALGETGELVVRGPHVMKGYWENPQSTALALRPGPEPDERVLYSGDLFRTDTDGYLYFVSRKDDIIKTRGEKVSPKEVEVILYSLPSVREAIVVGVPDPVLGQAVKAVIVPNEGTTLTAREVIAHCTRHLEDFMVPRLVEFRSDLPKTDNGKIRRSEIQAEALGPTGATVGGRNE